MLLLAPYFQYVSLTNLVDRSSIVRLPFFPSWIFGRKRGLEQQLFDQFPEYFSLLLEVSNRFDGNYLPLHNIRHLLRDFDTREQKHLKLWSFPGNGRGVHSVSQALKARELKAFFTMTDTYIRTISMCLMTLLPM